MALTQWKDFDDFFTDPWRHHRELMSSFKLWDPWKEDFGFGLASRDLFRFPTWNFEEFERRAREMEERMFKKMNEILPTTGKDGFEVRVDARHFNPNEITVKTIGNSVIIEGKHEEKEEQPSQRKYLSRQFTQRYDLPYGYDASMITSELTDGYLTVKAPKPKAIEGKERIIPIEQTGKQGQLVKA